MITKDYERFFKVALEDFQKQSITQLEKLLSTLDLEPTLILTQENLTAEPLVQIIKSDLEDEDKILALTLLMGEWFIAKVSGTWSIAPTEPIDLQKAIISFGYGVLSCSRKSFFPTASWARDLNAGDSIEGAVALLNATAKQWSSEH
jgi:hypothetical protein